MSIRTSFNPLGTLGKVEFLEEVSITKGVSVPSVFTSWSDLDDVETALTCRIESFTQGQDPFSLMPNNASAARYKFNFWDGRLYVANNTLGGYIMPYLDGVKTLMLDRRGVSVDGEFFFSCPNGHAWDGAASSFTIAKQRFSKFTIKRNGVLLAEWRAARLNGEDGIFDTVSKQFKVV